MSDCSAGDGAAAFNSWAHSHLARALLAYYQGTGDRRILEALRIAYSDFPLAATMHQFSGVPSEVNVDPMLEVYRLTGDKRLLEQVLAFARQPSLRKHYLEDWPASDDKARCQHGVCFIEGNRVPALLYPWTGDRWMLDSAVETFDWAQQRHMLPCGVPSSEEFLAGIGAFRCIETCNVPCWIGSQVALLRVAGEARFADAAELAFFNAGPAPIARDWQTMCYYQSPNRMSTALPAAEPRAPGKSAFPIHADRQRNALLRGQREPAHPELHHSHVDGRARQRTCGYALRTVYCVGQGRRRRARQAHLRNGLSLRGGNPHPGRA